VIVCMICSKFLSKSCLSYLCNSENPNYDATANKMYRVYKLYTNDCK